MENSRYCQAGKGSLVYVNDTFDIDACMVKVSLSYCKVFKFTVLIDSIVYMWPVLCMLLDGVSGVNLTIFYLIMFLKVKPLLEIENAEVHGKMPIFVMTEMMNKIEDYMWLKKTIITCETVLMVFTVILGVFVSSDLIGQRKDVPITNIVTSIRVCILWFIHIGQFFMKENLSDIVG